MSLGVFKGLVDSFVKIARGDNFAPVRLSQYRSVFTQQCEPALMELARCGRLFSVVTSAVAGGRTPVQDIPTTTANWLIFNPASSGKIMVPIKCGVFLASGTEAAGHTVIGGVTPQKLADAQALTSNAANHGVGITRGSAGSALQPFVGVNVTVPTMASQFRALGGAETTANATVGDGPASNLMMDGADIIQPGFGFALDVLSGTGTTSKFGISMLIGVFDGLEVD